jgi:hypothetical protein
LTALPNAERAGGADAGRAVLLNLLVPDVAVM